MSPDVLPNFRAGSASRNRRCPGTKNCYRDPDGPSTGDFKLQSGFLRNRRKIIRVSIEILELMFGIP